MSRMNEERWQGNLADRSEVVFLVRGLLGCTCPQEVFDHYQVGQRVLTSMPLVELIMGDRLLVWIIDGDRIGEPERILSELLRGGLEERERRGLNRFRLVVVGDFRSWEERWAHLPEELDPKVHLHVLPEIIGVRSVGVNRRESESTIFARWQMIPTTGLI